MNYKAGAPEPLGGRKGVQPLCAQQEHEGRDQALSTQEEIGAGSPWMEPWLSLGHSTQYLGGTASLNPHSPSESVTCMSGSTTGPRSHSGT